MKVLSRKMIRASHAEKTPEKGVVDERMRSPLFHNAQPQAPISPSWAELPALNKVLDLLTDPKDLIACACVCKSWSAEVASSDHLFQQAWTRQVSDQGLWRWSRAEGGYREQIRADSVVQKGDCIATVFPLNRREGRISEVLLLDAKPEPRICTMHTRPTPAHCIRLTGWTVKVWSASTLSSQKSPLCIIHDVVKHLQLEDGRLFLWRIKEGAVVQIRSSGVTGAGAEEEEERINHWTENPNIIASVLDPITLEVVDIPLDSTYGHRMCPFEFIDGGVSGVLISGGAFPAENKLKIRLLDLHTGQCFRESSIILPDVGADHLQLHPDGAAVLMSRNSDVGGQYLSAVVLYDCRVFRWRLKDEWLAVETRYTTGNTNSTATSTSQSGSPQVPAAAAQGEGENIDNTIAPPASTGLSPLEAAVAAAGDDPYGGLSYDHDGLHLPNIPYGLGGSIKTEPAAQFSLHHIFTTPLFEAIVDLSMSTAAQRIYVLGLENLYVLGDDGTLQITCRMSNFRGVRDSRRYTSSFDVGAFSWPLPNSRQAAFYLDVTNSIYIADFEPAPRDSFPSSSSGPYGADDTGEHHGVASGQLPYRDRLFSLVEDISGQDPFSSNYFTQKSLMPLQSHTNLLPRPKNAPITSFTGRLTRDMDAEPVILEYIQSGRTIFTSGHSSCSATAALLKAEKEAGTYLYGLGPKSVKTGKGAKAGPFVSRPGGTTVGSGGSSGSCNNNKLKTKKSGARSSTGSANSNNTDLAPRALICIDTKTGRRYKTIPIEGVIESVHAAGHLLVAAVAPIDGYSTGAEGCLVFIDFSKEGFGLTDAQREAYNLEIEGKSSLFGKKKSEKEVVEVAEAVAARAKNEVETGPSKAKRRRRSGK